MTSMMRYPFEVSYAEVEAYVETFVDAVFDTLQSSFLLIPRGQGFITYPEFQQAYEVLKRCTVGFTAIEPGHVMNALQEEALAFIVVRAMLGFTPPELAYFASQESEITVSQSFARTLDRQIRTKEQVFRAMTSKKQDRVTAMVAAACLLLNRGPSQIPPETIHRLDKADTRTGADGIRHVANEGIPYSMLLYERFLGRPFATHRDSISELVGQVMEDAVEAQLRHAGISYRLTKRAERIEGFDQAPDFIVPDEWSPQIVIEAKVAEDDGTARDKVTRIQHLAELSRQREVQGQPRFHVIACIDGRGFGVRREDMRKLLEATQGKVFTFATLNRLVESTDLHKFRSNHTPDV